MIAICVLAGIAIGLRFRVLIFLVAVVFAPMFLVMLGILRADDFQSICFGTIAAVIAMQLGYLGGAAIDAITAGEAMPVGNWRHRRWSSWTLTSPGH